MTKAAIETPAKNHTFGSLAINLTNRCNLACKYCFQNSGGLFSDKLDFFRVKEILDYHTQKIHTKKKYVQFTGGEIFLHKDIFQIIKYALKDGWTVRLQTNGTIISSLTPMEIEILKSPNIVFKVSLDGWNTKSHELYRTKGSFNPTVKGIETLTKAGVQVGIKTVIHHGNYQQLYKILDLCNELKVVGFSYNLLRKQGRAGVLIEPIDFEFTEEMVADKILPYLTTQKYIHLLNGTNILRYYLGKDLLTTRGYYVDWDGKVYPNQDCLSNEFLGDVFVDNFDLIFNPNKLTKKVRYFPSNDLMTKINDYLDPIFKERKGGEDGNDS